MLHTPKLSIVMPFFNHEELVAEMIDSIRANDYQDWELLAIDDGSTAETAAFLSKRYQDDGRIRFIPRSREPKGAQTCRNMGLEMARGEFIVFFDSDDYVAPYCLRQRVEAISKRTDLDFMVFPSGTYNDGTFRIQDSHDLYGYPIYKDDLAAFLERTLPFIVWSNIYRIEPLRQQKISWDTNLLSLQDSDFNIQALLHGLHYDYAHAKPDYGYRTEANGSSVSKKIPSERHRKSHLYFVNKQYEEVQRKYHGWYDLNLYHGVLYIFSSALADGIETDFSMQLADIVCQHDRWRGKMLRLKIKTGLMLGHILPQKVARQLPMPLFLIRKRLMERVIIPRRIADYQKTSQPSS